MKQQTLEEWKKEAEEKYGTDFKKWEFVCPACGCVQKFTDFIKVGVSEEEAKTVFYFSCIGRWDESKGCDWTVGGFLQIHKKEVINQEGEAVPVFEFSK